MDKNNNLDGFLKKIIIEIEWNRKDFESHSISYEEYKKNINYFIAILQNMYEKI